MRFAPVMLVPCVLLSGLVSGAPAAPAAPLLVQARAARRRRDRDGRSSSKRTPMPRGSIAGG